jgi:hypothetical protein
MSYIIECITVIKENYFLVIKTHKTLINFKICLSNLTSILTPTKCFVIPGFKTTQISHVVDLFVKCLRNKFHITRRK